MSVCQAGGGELDDEDWEQASSRSPFGTVHPTIYVASPESREGRRTTALAATWGLTPLGQPLGPHEPRRSASRGKLHLARAETCYNYRAARNETARQTVAALDAKVKWDNDRRRREYDVYNLLARNSLPRAQSEPSELVHPTRTGLRGTSMARVQTPLLGGRRRVTQGEVGTSHGRGHCTRSRTRDHQRTASDTRTRRHGGHSQLISLDSDCFVAPDVDSSTPTGPEDGASSADAMITAIDRSTKGQETTQETRGASTVGSCSATMLAPLAESVAPPARPATLSYWSDLNATGVWRRSMERKWVRLERAA
jgi:hypothetical protein